MDIYNEDILNRYVSISNSYKDMFNKMGLAYANGRYNKIKEHIKKYNISTEHFKYKERKNLSNEEIFIKNSTSDRTVVKYRIIKDNLIEYKCHSCGCNDEWLGKKMPLILDHINGINNDNRLENLRFLCSNCDSIQDTYKGRNRDKITTKKINIKILENKIKKKEIIDFKITQILEANIDFSKKTWGVEAAKILNCSPQYALKFVKKNILKIT